MMQFTTTQQHLSRGLSIVNHAVPGKIAQPIQAYILAMNDGERIRLSAMREDMGIHCWIPASCITEVDTTLLPMKIVTEVVGGLPSSSVTITAPSPNDAGSCNVCCQRMNADIKNAGQDPAEFPSIPTFSDGGERLLVLDTELLKQIIAQVAFAAARQDDNRYELTGLRIEIGDGQAVFAAADSFHLAVRTLSIPDDQLRCELLVPAHTLIRLAKILPSQGVVQVLLTRGHSQMLFHTDTIDLSCRLLSGAFPEFRRVIPDTWTTRVVLQKEELATAVRQMVPFAQAGDHTTNKPVVHLTIAGENSTQKEPHTLTLEAITQDIGSNESVLSGEITGPDQQVALHITHLGDVLSVIEETEITLEVSHNRPVVIRPVGATNAVYVLMPVYIQHPSVVKPATTEQEQTEQQPVAVTH